MRLMNIQLTPNNLLVTINAGCFLFPSYISVLVGVLAALFALIGIPFWDKMWVSITDPLTSKLDWFNYRGMDDPIGALSVHFLGGIWGQISVGLFAQNPVPLSSTSGRSGLFYGKSKVKVRSNKCLNFFHFNRWRILLAWCSNLLSLLFNLVGPDCNVSDPLDCQQNHSDSSFTRRWNQGLWFGGTLHGRWKRENVAVTDPR